MEGQHRKRVLQHLIQLAGVAEILLHEVEVVIRIDRGELAAQQQGVPVADENGLDPGEFFDGLHVRAEETTAGKAAPHGKSGSGEVMATRFRVEMPGRAWQNWRMAKEGMKVQRLTKEARDELTRRVLAGEKGPQLAKEFGVTRAYVSLVKVTALDPERFKRKAEAKLLRKLTEAEIARLQEIFKTSTPEDHDLLPIRERWALEHGIELARKLFGKTPSPRAMRACMGDLLKRRPAHEYDPKPMPPKVKTLKQIDPELAKDPTYVAYIQSEIYQKIAWREYEMALADWKRRHPEDGDEGAGAESAGKPDFPKSLPSTAAPAPGQRVGKHAKSKGSRFTPPKKRGKKRK